MGLLLQKLGIRNFSFEDPAQPLLPYSALVESLGMGKSDAGVLVNEKQAMRLTTTFSCINVIATDASTLPLSIFQTMPDGSIREATEHWLYGLLHDAPNDKMSSTTFRGAMLASVLGWGNAYALIRRDKANRPVSLEKLPSDRTNPALIDGELIYVTTATKDGMPAAIDPEDIIHFAGLSMDGLVGLSPIGTCKNAFGLGLAAEKFGAQFFGNGSRATGIFTHPGELDAEAYENLKKSVREQANGENALRPLILEEGMTWQQLTIAPNDAQFLQTRQFQRAEIASLYRVPLHLLQDLTRSTNNNIEHQSLDYLRYTLRPWLVRFEQELNRKLLKGPFHCQHDMNEFQRGDFQSQTAGLQVLFNMGVNSIDDTRKALHYNPIGEEEGGNLRMVPLNMVPVQHALNPPEPDPGAKQQEAADPDPGETPPADRFRNPITAQYRRLFRDAVGRVVNRSGAPDVNFVYRALLPIVVSMGEAIMAARLSYGPDEDDHRAFRDLANVYAVRVSGGCNKQNASLFATDIVGAAYNDLTQLLIGGI